MMTQMYSIYDKLEKTFSAPFLVPNRDIAMRMVTDQLDKIPHINDKQLHYVGSFDPATGISTAATKDQKFSVSLESLKGGPDV